MKLLEPPNTAKQREKKRDGNKKRVIMPGLGDVEQIAMQDSSYCAFQTINIACTRRSPSHHKFGSAPQELQP